MEKSSNNKNKKKTGASQHTVVCTKPAPVYLFGQIGDENDWPVYFHPLAHSSHVKCETGNIAGLRAMSPQYIFTKSFFVVDLNW